MEAFLECWGCRSAFIAQEGWLMISGDYKQQELRVMAHLSQDQTLIQHLQEGDPFSVIAGEWHRKEVAEVEKHPLFAV